MTLTRITADPGQMGGVPCIRSLRVPVAMVADGMAEDEILAAYPDFERDDIREALRSAAELCASGCSLSRSREISAGQCVVAGSRRAAASKRPRRGHVRDCGLRNAADEEIFARAADEDRIDTEAAMSYADIFATGRRWRRSIG
jgi:uncharacterized protein (DUF433 family)